jgi:hypothetical protein
VHSVYIFFVLTLNIFFSKGNVVSMGTWSLDTA